MPDQGNLQVPHEALLRMVTEIVTSYVRATKLPWAQLPEIIRIVYDNLGRPVAPIPPRPEPAVPIRRSVTAEHIICLEDGKKLKMLKRYLMTTYGMTPDDYRTKWDLPKDYPMVAPSYAQRRSSLAKESGLGRRLPPAPPSEPAAPPPAPRRRRGRPPRAG
jgi:predicted transcriptional regulator